MHKILIIEDEKDIRQSVADILKINNFRVTEAADGHEGLITALKIRPDIIISDIMMPGFNGHELVKHLQTNSALADTPVIFLTAKAQPADFRAGLKLGAADYITKPFKMKELLDSIHRIIRKVEAAKHKEQKFFTLFFENPFSGVFYMEENKFKKINKRFSEITGFSANEMQHKALPSLFGSKEKESTERIINCGGGVKDTDRFNALLISKDKKPIETEIFLQHLPLEGKSALLGIVSKTTNEEEQQQHETKINYLVNFFRENNSQQIAEKILNAEKILSFSGDQEQEDIKRRINLTPREKEVLYLICKGLTNPEIGEKLYISNRTVDNHRAKILQKTETKNTAALVAFSIKNGLVDL